MEDLVGKFVNSAKTTTTTAGAAAKKGTDLVKSINPRPQQTEVASPEASQGMASIILGAVGYQQTRREETAGEGSDTSEAIDGETSSNQEVINETGVEENNSDFTLQTFDDDVYVSPAPLENDIPSHTSLPSPFEKVVFPPPPLPQVDDIPEPPPSPVDDAFQNIIQEANPDTKKSRLEQFFTPNDDKETTLKKANLILKDLKNSAPNKIIKDALEAFLKNPSNDKDVLKEQCNLADSSVLKEIFNEDDKQIIIDLLNKSSDNNDTFKIQCDLANSSVWSNRLNVYDKKIITDLLSKPSDDQKALKYQCILARSSVLNKIFNEDDKNIITDLLQTPSEDNDTFKAQCDLAKTAVANGILKAEEQTDKEIITKFLQTPSDYPGTFKAQCNLAEAIKADDAIILQNLFSPSNDDWIRYTQQFFMSDMLNNKINADSDDSQKAFAKAALLNFLAEDDDNMNDDLLIKQYDFTQTAVTKGILKAEDKEIITKFLQTPSNNNDTFKAQYDLAKAAIKNGIMEPEKCEEILDKVKNLILVELSPTSLAALLFTPTLSI